MEFIDDDITPEEAARYLGFAVPSAPKRSGGGGGGMFYGGSSSSGSKRGNLLLDADDDYDDDDPFDARAMDEALYSNKSRVEMLDDSDVPKDPLFERMEFLVEIRRMGGSKQIIPLEAQKAAGTLLHLASNEGGNLISLDGASRAGLKQLTSGVVDEFTQVDPYVVLSTSIVLTDSCRVFLEEAVHFSEYMLLRVLHARFPLVINEKVKMRPIPFDDPELELHVAPYEGADTRGQPFNVAQCLEQVMEQVAPDKHIQIRAHMLAMGKMSPRQVCDHEFIEDQMEVFKDILGGRLRIVREKKKRREIQE